MKDGRGADERTRADAQPPALLPDGGIQTSDFPASDVRFQIEWAYTVHVETGPVEFRLDRTLFEDDNPDVESLVPLLRWSGEFPDDRADWHRNYTPLRRWILAHITRLVRGDTHQDLITYFEEDEHRAARLGFFDNGQSVIDEYDQSGDSNGVPGYTQLRDMWAENFSDRTRGACIVIAERLAELAREHGLPAPDEVFRPDENVEPDEVDEDDPTVRELTTEKTAEVWEHARPMVLKHWHLKRHHNWQVPEPTFFDAHAHLATESDDVFPESGLGNMAAKSNHDRVHFPSTHRRELKKFSIGEIRELHRSVTKDLIREARREGELVGKLSVAIDVTKGHPWTGEVERNPDGSNAEPYVLGYKNDNDTRTQYYFQWANIQIVGLDIPLILDMVPVHRGYSRGDIVDDLLEHATDMVDDIETVYMDADYDSAAVKNAAEKHGVYYMNRKSRDRTDKKRMRRMWDNQKAVRVFDEEDRQGMPMRKTVYVPHIAVNDDEDDEDSDDGLRQELLSDFGEAGGDSDEMPDESPFESLLDDMREEEGGEDGDVDPTQMYVPFETNHPLADKRGANGRDEISKKEQRHGAARMVRQYGRRWGIENGYKKVGHFLPRSGSKDPVLRFFGFAFAATLCNCWRLVDLMVKLTVEDDPDYTPLVTASRFLAVAEGMFGLGSKPPPD